MADLNLKAAVDAVFLLPKDQNEILLIEEPIVKPILDLIELYYKDAFVAPFIFDTIISGDEWAVDMGQTPFQRIFSAIIQIEEYFKNTRRHDEYSPYS